MIRRLSLTLALALPALVAVAQPPADLGSPRATMLTFLSAVNAVRDGDPAALERAIDALDLAALGVEPSSEAARNAARQLWAALNRIRLVEASELPGRAELQPADSTFVYFPRPFNPADEAILERIELGDERIVLARQPDGRWLFSAATVAGIGRLATALRALPPQVKVDEEALVTPGWVRTFVPAPLQTGAFAGLRYWQWAGLLGIIFVALVGDLIARTLLRPVVGRAVWRFNVAVDPRGSRELVRGLGLFTGALLLLALLPGLALVDAIGGVTRSAAGVLTVLAGTLAGWRLTDLVGLVLLEKSKETESKFDDVLVPLFRKTLKIFIVAGGLIYGAQFLNIDIVPLLTGLGIGGLAFAFAAKDTIENLFGSVAVILDRPFEVGDWIVTGDVEGTVETMGFRSTRVRTFHNSQVTVPNAALVRATVDNYGRRRYRRWKTLLGVQYDTSPEKLLAFTEGLRELVKQHPYTRKDYYQIWCNDFADSSINVLLYVFFEVPDWSTELRERERLLIDVVRLADRLGVQFAFPTQTVHLFKEEHREPEPAHPVPAGDHDDRAMQAGADAAGAIVRDRSWCRERPGPVDYGRPAGQADGGDAGE
ncbi:MAG: mechanosensitive ion channel family protein [Gemmatimonadales bacterium]